MPQLLKKTMSAIGIQSGIDVAGSFLPIFFLPNEDVPSLANVIPGVLHCQSPRGPSHLQESTVHHLLNRPLLNTIQAVLGMGDKQ